MTEANAPEKSDGTAGGKDSEEDGAPVSADVVVAAAAVPAVAAAPASLEAPSPAVRGLNRLLLETRDTLRGAAALEAAVAAVNGVIAAVVIAAVVIGVAPFSALLMKRLYRRFGCEARSREGRWASSFESPVYLATTWRWPAVLLRHGRVQRSGCRPASPIW